MYAKERVLKGLPNSNASEPETLSETLQNLGVPVERSKGREITGVKWLAGKRYRKTKSGLIAFSKHGVYLPQEVGDDLEDRVDVGVGVFSGRKVLLLKSDPDGYRVTTPYKGRKKRIANKSMPGYLIGEGLEFGYYEPKKIKGGWMGIPKADPAKC